MKTLNIFLQLSYLRESTNPNIKAGTEDLPISPSPGHKDISPPTKLSRVSEIIIRSSTARAKKLGKWIAFGMCRVLRWLCFLINSPFESPYCLHFYFFSVFFFFILVPFLIFIFLKWGWFFSFLFWFISSYFFICDVNVLKHFFYISTLQTLLNKTTKISNDLTTPKIFTHSSTQHSYPKEKQTNKQIHSLLTDEVPQK